MPNQVAVEPAVSKLAYQEGIGGHSGDRKEDLFYKEVEGRMESLKRRPAEKEKTTRSEKINVTFNVIIGLVILLGVIFTLFRVLGGS